MLLLLFMQNILCWLDLKIVEVYLEADVKGESVDTRFCDNSSLDYFIYI